MHPVGGWVVRDAGPLHGLLKSIRHTCSAAGSMLGVVWVSPSFMRGCAAGCAAGRLGLAASVGTRCAEPCKWNRRGVWYVFAGVGVMKRRGVMLYAA